MLAVFAVNALATWRWRVGSILGALFMVLLVSFSRVYLGAHYLSDVLGAAAVGIAWLVLCLTAVDTLRRSRGAVKSRHTCGSGASPSRDIPPSPSSTAPDTGNPPASSPTPRRNHT